MNMYRTTSIGRRDCMGMVNTKDPSLAMHLSHLAFDIWAKAIVSYCVTLKTPPSVKELQWFPISNAQS
ncbi:hypothetical protein DFH28DRAFT_852315, partial [Melampsora americana]